MQETTRLLIVDDDEAIRSFFQEIFLEDGFRVDCVANGEEATRRIADTTYDVVITDLCMPKMDGIRLLQEIEQVDATVVVVAITGFGTIKDAVTLMKAGAFDVLTKPFSLDEIRVTLDKALLHRSLTLKNRDLEHRLRTSEKLAAIGQLAAGVAHEINNPLDGVIRFINLSLDRLPGTDPVRGYLTECRTGLKRIAGIVRNLLNFSRSIVRESEPRRLVEVLHEAVEPLRHLPQAASATLDLEIDHGAVRVPGAYLHVFANLIKNALDEVPDGGGIRVRSRGTDTGLEVSVSDDGPGIAPELHDRVFEPFFTTKKMGRGTGLGLSICQQIVEKQGGRITLESTVGEGSTFTVLIPWSPGERPTKVARATPGPAMRS